jgi:putative endopeptidase
MLKYSFLVSVVLSTSLLFAQKNSGIRIDIIDKSVDPKEDFFKYACGNWLKNNSIPETESAWGSFNEIKERNDKNLKDIISELSKDKTATPGTDRQKLRDFYNLAMDTNKLEKDGLKFIAPYFNSVDKITNNDQLINTIADFHASGISCFFGFGIARRPGQAGPSQRIFCSPSQPFGRVG